MNNQRDFSGANTQTIIKTAFKFKWEREHPAHRKDDAYHKLSRLDQVTMFRLRHHLFHRYKIGKDVVYTCDASPMTAEHLFRPAQPTVMKEIVHDSKRFPSTKAVWRCWKP
jgi:hypothetical protein